MEILPLCASIKVSCLSELCILCQKFLEMSETLKVFCFMRACEGLHSLASGIFHAVAFNDPGEKSSAKFFVYCAFIGNLALSGLALYKMVTRKSRYWFGHEATSTLPGFFVFIWISMLTMKDLENDPHLGYLTEKQESKHPFFMSSRTQSILTLMLGATLLFHGLGALEVLKKQKPRRYGERTDILYFFIQYMFNNSRRKVKKYLRNSNPNWEADELRFHLILFLHQL